MHISHMHEVGESRKHVRWFSPGCYARLPWRRRNRSSRRSSSSRSGEPHLSAEMRAVLSVFENYQKARVNFVQTVAELATRPQNIEALQNAGVMQLLRPLLLDNVPSIQQSAALALGRLANYNDELAEAVVSNEVLPQLVYSCLLYTSPSPRDQRGSRMPSSA